MIFVVNARRHDGTMIKKTIILKYYKRARLDCPPHYGKCGRDVICIRNKGRGPENTMHCILGGGTTE